MLHLRCWPFCCVISPPRGGGDLGEPAGVCLPGTDSLKSCPRSLAKDANPLSKTRWDRSLGAVSASLRGTPCESSTCPFSCCRQTFLLLLSLPCVADFSTSPLTSSPLFLPAALSCSLVPASLPPPFFTTPFFPSPPFYFLPPPSDPDRRSPPRAVPSHPGSPESEPPLTSNHLVLELSRPFSSVLTS